MNQNIEVNPNREYYFGLDISASMNNSDSKCDGLTRYKYVLEKFKAFAKIAEDFDKHEGITVFLFGENVQVFPETKLSNLNVNLDSINFEGQTNLHLLLAKAFDEHLEEKRDLAKEGKICPGTQLLVFTDGEPTNRAAVTRELVRISESIDREDEFNIVFLTVGTIPSDLSNYLENLHEEVEEKSKSKFDIIHVFEAGKIDFMKAVSANLHKE